MDVSNITVEDGRAVAALVQLINTGRWDLNGQEAQRLVEVRKWLASLAMQMGEKLRSAPKANTPAESSTSGMRVKAITPMGTPTPGGKKKGRK